MKEIISNIFTETKKISTKTWIAAFILPGGFVAVTTYILTKAIDNKEEKNDKGRDSKG